MNGTINAGEPSYTTGDHTTGNRKGGIIYDVGFSFVILLFITTICYVSYMCKRNTTPRQPPPRITSFRTASDSDSDDCTRLSNSLDDDIISTLPTFLYSEMVKLPHKLDTKTDNFAIDYGSGCSICLEDYRPADVLRLLPECGHVFHVNCIDTWLKVQPTCPVCRNSPLSSSSELI